jgi:hypothetical protein
MQHRMRCWSRTLNHDITFEKSLLSTKVNVLEDLQEDKLLVHDEITDFITSKKKNL